MKIPGLIGPDDMRDAPKYLGGNDALLMAADHALAFARDAKAARDRATDRDTGIAMQSAMLMCAVIAANLRTMARAIHS
jgi:hypothetical protein